MLQTPRVRTALKIAAAVLFSASLYTADLSLEALRQVVSDPNGQTWIGIATVFTGSLMALIAGFVCLEVQNPARSGLGSCLLYAQLRAEEVICLALYLLVGAAIPVALIVLSEPNSAFSLLFLAPLPVLGFTLLLDGVASGAFEALRSGGLLALRRVLLKAAIGVCGGVFLLALFAGFLIFLSSAMSGAGNKYNSLILELLVLFALASVPLLMFLVLFSRTPKAIAQPTPLSALRRVTALALTLLLLPALGVMAADRVAPRAWTTTGSLNVARQHHTATLLADGRVLVSGGCAKTECPDALDSSEISNPATGQWTPVGDLHTARSNHTATLLRDGKVLVTGGKGGGDYTGKLATSELYDPATRQWTPTGNLTTRRANHTATRLPDGQVLVTGGSQIDTDPDSELYNPATGRWTLTRNSGLQREKHTATLLSNGKVLVTGGEGFVTTRSGSAAVTSTEYFTLSELYEPATAQWTLTGDLKTGRTQHSATLLSDGKVLVMGGCTDFYCNKPLSSAEVYDPETGEWTSAGNMSTGRVLAGATLLPSGSVLVSGGYGNVGKVVNTELYNPTTGTFSTVGNLNDVRYAHASTLLANGQVLVTGGFDPNGAVARSELYQARLTP